MRKVDSGCNPEPVESPCAWNALGFRVALDLWLPSPFPFGDRIVAPAVPCLCRCAGELSRHPVSLGSQVPRSGPHGTYHPGEERLDSGADVVQVTFGTWSSCYGGMTAWGTSEGGHMCWGDLPEGRILRWPHDSGPWCTHTSSTRVNLATAVKGFLKM